MLITLAWIETVATPANALLAWALGLVLKRLDGASSNGVHAMFYSSDPEATRAFLRNIVGLNANDAGGEWLIFPVSEAEVAVHPTEDTEATAGSHEFSFYCDDIHATVAELKTRGATFSGEVEDTGWGLVTHLQIPGGCSAMLYQRKY